MDITQLPEQPISQQPPAMQELMAGLIDYAGLFPPSRLPLSEAMANYARFRSEQDAWMMSRFIIPDERLRELEPLSELFKDNPPYRFSVTFKGGETYDWFLENLKTTLARIKNFEEQHGSSVKVEMLEGRLPVFENGSHNPETLLIFFQSISKLIVTTLGRKLDTFIEVPWTIQFDDDFKSTHDDLFDHAATAIKWHNEKKDDDRVTLGFKLRCGGERPEEVPSPEIVASALDHVNQKNIPFKATAGLHHPFRNYHDEFGGMMHGFVNVFAAGILGKKYRLSQKDLIEIIIEEIAARFTITPTTFGWGDYLVKLNEINESRHRQYISYGSCSFDEPREDLVQLGLLK